jgi:hypothetical protein
LPSFDAGTVVEALEFTFEPFVKGCKGVIAEPSDTQIAAFLESIKKITAQAKSALPADVAAGSPAALMDAAEDLDPEQAVKLMHDMARAYAGLCSGFPSAEQILGLSMRRRQGFYMWLMTEVMNPEAVPGAGRA